MWQYWIISILLVVASKAALLQSALFQLLRMDMCSVLGRWTLCICLVHWALTGGCLGCGHKDMHGVLAGVSWARSLGAWTLRAHRFLTILPKC